MIFRKSTAHANGIALMNYIISVTEKIFSLGGAANTNHLYALLLFKEVYIEQPTSQKPNTNTNKKLMYMALKSHVILLKQYETEISNLRKKYSDKALDKIIPNYIATLTNINSAITSTVTKLRKIKQDGNIDLKVCDLISSMESAEDEYTAFIKLIQKNKEHLKILHRRIFADNAWKYLTVLAGLVIATITLIYKLRS